ncbi:MAG TPA: ATP-binding protein [Noviherbaspirillum sp.]|jgi:signal transduction histidine kinase/ActR/RegA family two-component response regulator|uniref:hybrid sensor histidine kinase/response regulator n=1 Tax=Noviherbaspirillum sp. TaxID=1926288 RepID=UPI002DDDBBC4|nr:ATP-binding protein [Noviherbaspirillum sp.]HEV2608691.1 ATP-binding protein [Noviherbaspirillum sp.]
MKTRSYLILIIGLILLPVLALSGWGLHLLLEKEKEARLLAVEEKTRSIALAIDQELADAEGALRVIAQTEHMYREDFRPLYDLMKKTITSSDSWAVLYDAHGNILAHTHHPYGAAFTEPLSTWVPAAIDARKSSVSNLRDGRAGKWKVVSVNVPVTTASGKKFLLAYTFHVGHITKLLHREDLSKTWVVGVFGSDGVTIARNLREMDFIGTSVTAALLEASKNQFSGRIVNFTRDKFWAYTTFIHASRADWTVAIAAPTEEINSPARTATFYAALALFVVLGCAFAGITFFARRITRSFQLTLAGAKSLELGRIPRVKKSGVVEADLLQHALHEAGTKLAEENRTRKLLEQERERLLESEQEARRQAENQNNAKDEFLAMLAHELRNPLSPIAAAAQLLKISGRNEKVLQQSSDIIVRQVGHLQTLIDDLLDVSRVTRGLVRLDKQEVDIKSVVTNAVEQVRPLLELRGHDLHLHMRPAHAAVLGDKTRLIQVVSNLLNNAAKYTPEGGTITLEVEVQATNVKISVMDNGIGMEQDLLPYVFELFRQARRTPDRSQGGLGLGLALVRSITSLHGGHVEAQSDGPGKGSRFTLSLPLIAAGESESEPADESICVPVKPVRLMIVDDNVDAANSLASLLEAKGHSVIVKDNPYSAIEHSRNDPLPLYILDIGLPGMDGYELARQLRALPATANAVLIALTGYGQTNDKKLALAAGFAHHFVKPMDIEALDQILASVNNSGVAESGHGLTSQI